MVSTLAGNGSSGYLDGPSSIAQFKAPQDMCDDGFGNVYVADADNQRIRLININTNIGMNTFMLPRFNLLLNVNKKLNKVSTFAGNGAIGILDGPILNAEFSALGALFCQTSSSTTIFIIDTLNYYYLRKIENGLLII